MTFKTRLGIVLESILLVAAVGNLGILVSMAADSLSSSATGEQLGAAIVFVLYIIFAAIALGISLIGIPTSIVGSKRNIGAVEIFYRVSLAIHIISAALAIILFVVLRLVLS